MIKIADLNDRYKVIIKGKHVSEYCSPLTITQVSDGNGGYCEKKSICYAWMHGGNNPFTKKCDHLLAKMLLDRQHGMPLDGIVKYIDFLDKHLPAGSIIREQFKGELHIRFNIKDFTRERFYAYASLLRFAYETKGDAENMVCMVGECGVDFYAAWALLHSMGMDAEGHNIYDSYYARGIPYIWLVKLVHDVVCQDKRIDDWQGKFDGFRELCSNNMKALLLKKDIAAIFKVGKHDKPESVLLPNDQIRALIALDWKECLVAHDAAIDWE